MQPRHGSKLEVVRQALAADVALHVNIMTLRRSVQAYRQALTAVWSPMRFAGLQLRRPGGTARAT